MIESFKNLSVRTHSFLGFCACLFLMSYALYAEHMLGLEPCPMCIFQRLSTILLGLVFLIGSFPITSPFSRLIIGLLISLTSLSGILVASRHVWLQNLPKVCDNELRILHTRYYPRHRCFRHTHLLSLAPRLRSQQADLYYGKKMEFEQSRHAKLLSLIDI